MSTNGIYGFRKSNTDKLTYNHFDSYPGGLGALIINFIGQTTIHEMRSLYDKIQMVERSDIPTDEQIQHCKPWTDLNVENCSTSSWYCLLRKSQGELDAYKKGLQFMLKPNSLSGEFMYIINIDTKELEFWINDCNIKDQQLASRYGTANFFGSANFYLAAAFHLVLIQDGFDAVKFMNNLIFKV